MAARRLRMYIPNRPIVFLLFCLPAYALARYVGYNVLKYKGSAGTRASVSGASSGFQVGECFLVRESYGARVGG
jgi:hypothetical protein